MLILTEGHKYIATNFEDKSGGQTIQFIEKEALLWLNKRTQDRIKRGVEGKQVK